MSLGSRAPARSCSHANSMQHMKPIISQAGRLFGRRWSTFTQAPHHAALNTGLGSRSIAWPSRKITAEPTYQWQAVAAASTATASPQQTLPARDAKRVKQTVDYTTLTALCEELRQTWLPAKVEEVVQPDKYTLALRLRTLDEQGWLHLSWHPTAARICMGQQPHRGAASEAFSFAEQGNVQLRGLVLTDVSMPQPWERVVQLSFGTRPGEPPSRLAYVEVMSRYSNVVLTDGGGEILLCAHQVGGKMSSLRLVQQGRAYQLPPVVAGVPPDSCEGLEQWQHTVQGAARLLEAGHAAEAADAAGSKSGRQRPATVSEAVVRSFLAASPSLLEELCAAAGISPAAAVGELEAQQWSSLYGQWQGWLARLAAKDFAPSADDATGRLSVLGSYSRHCSSSHAMLEQYYGQLQGGELHAQLHQKLHAAVAGLLKKARSKIFAFNKQLAEAGRAEEVQKRGDMIIANVYRIPPGSSSVQVEDWESGEQLTLVLDPELSAVEQAEGLFKKARKLRRAVDAVQPLLQAAQSDLEYLEELEASVQLLGTFSEADDLRALAEVQEELVEAGLIKPPPEASLAVKGAAKGKKATKKAAGKAVAKGASKGGAAAACRQFTSPSGLQVLVGRNNKQNDVLSLQIANAQDIWMHVQGMPGSHTVLRLPPGKEASDQDVQFAADLAAYYSKARNEGKAPVVITKAANLKKPKGAKPGQVLITKGESTVIARPSNSFAAQQGMAD